VASGFIAGTAPVDAPVVAVGLSVAGGCGRHALSTAARELRPGGGGGGGGRRARGGAVVVGRDAHLAGVAQLETGAVRTTALHAAAAAAAGLVAAGAAAQRRADVRTPAIVVVARVATCSTSSTNKLLAAHVYAAYEVNSTTRTRTRARHGHGLFCGETDPHGPNGVSPQKSPCPCPCRARVVEFSYMLLCIAACNTNRVAARYCPQRVAR